MMFSPTVSLAGEGDADLLDDIAAAGAGRGAAAAPAAEEAELLGGAGGVGHDRSAARRRRERNREHAAGRACARSSCSNRCSNGSTLQFENDKLRTAIREKLGSRADELLREAGGTTAKSLIARDPAQATRVPDDPDYSLVKALQTAQQNFVITDPSLPDNPIGSSRLLDAHRPRLALPGKELSLPAGPADGPPSRRQNTQGGRRGLRHQCVFIELPHRRQRLQPTRARVDGAGNVVNYVGVQCQVTDPVGRGARREARARPSCRLCA